MPPQFIYFLLHSESLAQSLQQFLSSERYLLTQIESPDSLLKFVTYPRLPFDCLIVQDEPALLTVAKQLYEQGMLFPLVILQAEAKKIFQHPAVVAIDLGNLSQICHAIDQALAKFFSLPIVAANNLQKQNILRLQQQQQHEKFSDESCYIVGCHKRETQHFFQQMIPVKQQEFLQQLKSDYRQILLNYFIADKPLKPQIDQFINTVFWANIPVPKIIEIHMELIDEFSKQLKIEGRSDEVLLDYRLTLIDILAHLCEVYRSSIPKGVEP